jgi:hypothetical protein
VRLGLVESSHRGWRAISVWGGQLRESEIHDFHVPVTAHYDVLRIENVKSTQQCLRLLPCSLRPGKLRGLCFQERIGSASELFYRDNDWNRDVLARNFGEICQEEWVISKIVAQDVGVPEKNYAPPTR